MIVKIVRKFAKGKDGEWGSLSVMPNKVLLETKINGEPSGKPAIRIGADVFYFCQPHEEVTEFRVLALGTMIVCRQE